MTKRYSVGFIGLGMMGRPMARNLLKAGFPLVVHNRSSAPVEELVTAGAKNGRSPKGVAQGADVIVLCLPDSAAVQLVMEGPDGILKVISPGKVVVDTSTISPIVARRLAKKTAQLGADMLDAPISGGDIGAQEGTLAIMVGGKAETLEGVMPVLQAMGKTIVHMGDSGAGQLTKACNQIVTMLTLEAISEAFILSERAGVDPRKVRRALMGGFGQSRVLELHGQRILDTDFKPGFDYDMMAKDLAIVLEAGAEYGAPLPATRVVNDLMIAGGYASGHVT